MQKKFTSTKEEDESDGDEIEKASKRARSIIAREDRIPIWSLSYIFVGILGVGFLFTFYDIFNINVSFIQTCILVFGCRNPSDAAQYLGLPVFMNLLGYVVGTFVISPLSDRYGRRDVLLVTLLITGIGSLYNAFATDYASFTFARAITGIGIGADLSLVNTYINEVAPTNGRSRYTSILFIFSSIGGFLGIWLGLLLTTQPAAFPLGLPFALGSTGMMSQDGWRLMYGVGAALALVGILLRLELPESPRWLVSVGRIDEAEKIVSKMEKRAADKLGKRLPDVPEEEIIVVDDNNLIRSGQRVPFKELLISSPIYRKRTLILLLVWFVGYMTIYSVSAGLTVLLVALHFAPSEAGVIAAVGTIGFIAAALFAAVFGDRLERKDWLPIAAIITLAGSLLISLAESNFWFAVIGSITLFFGFDLWVPITYSWSTENYPTRARATGFGIVDGMGHIGGGIGVIIVSELASSQAFSVFEIFLTIASFQIISSLIAQKGVKTRGRRLDELSP